MNLDIKVETLRTKGGGGGGVGGGGGFIQVTSPLHMSAKTKKSLKAKRLKNNYCFLLNYKENTLL